MNRHVTETVVLQTYSLQIIGPNDGRELAALQGALKVREIMREAEENLSDLLPAGYEVQIQEWDSPGPDYKPAGMRWMRDPKLEEEHPHA